MGWSLLGAGILRALFFVGFDFGTAEPPALVLSLVAAVFIADYRVANLCPGKTQFRSLQWFKISIRSRDMSTPLYDTWLHQHSVL